MKVLFITNIPAPYRIDFFNELGKYVDLTVVFEAKHANNQGIKFNWNLEEISNFKPIFLNEGNINEKKINWKIFKYIKKGYYDEIVATNYSYLTEMAAIIYMKILGIPYYMETDGGMIRNENIIKKLYKKFLVSGAKGYFSPSEGSDRYLEYYGANSHTIYRYPFTSLKDADILEKAPSAEEKALLKMKLNIKEEKVIISIGRFIHIKGFDILLNACKYLDNDVRIIIIGGIPLQEYLSLVRKHKLSNVTFETFKSKEELSNYYKVADLFVLPTRGDIWGLVINEAMAHHLPVITTNKCVAGMELITNLENGFIVEVDNYEMLSEAIKKVIYNPDLEKMKKFSIDRIRSYTIEGMVQAHLDEFYKK